MKNKIFIYLTFILSFLIHQETKSNEQFNFDVKEILITDNGNKFIGTERGKIISNTGLIITANKFEYDKKLNLLNASGNVEVHDKINNYFIYSKKIIYNKNKELIITKEKSKAISAEDNIEINAEIFEYKLNLLNASGNVEVHDE